MGSTELSLRAATVELPGRKEPGVWSPLLEGRAGREAWRLAEAFSEKGLPFELEVTWSAGQGASRRVLVTVANASRVCVHAGYVCVRARNLAAVPNRVTVAVADGFALTGNVWEVRGSCDGKVPSTNGIPPFSRSLSVGVSKRTGLAGTVVRLLDGSGAVLTELSGAGQIEGRVEVGGASSVQVMTTEPLGYRVVFQLGL